jgi:hypothetical protein
MKLNGISPGGYVLSSAITLSRPKEFSHSLTHNRARERNWWNDTKLASRAPVEHVVSRHESVIRLHR